MPALTASLFRATIIAAPYSAEAMCRLRDHVTALRRKCDLGQIAGFRPEKSFYLIARRSFVAAAQAGNVEIAALLAPLVFHRANPPISTDGRQLVEPLRNLYATLLEQAGNVSTAVAQLAKLGVSQSTAVSIAVDHDDGRSAHLLRAVTHHFGEMDEETAICLLSNSLVCPGDVFRLLSEREARGVIASFAQTAREWPTQVNAAHSACRCIAGAYAAGHTALAIEVLRSLDVAPFPLRSPECDRHFHGEVRRRIEAERLLSVETLRLWEQWHDARNSR